MNILLNYSLIFILTFLINFTFAQASLQEQAKQFSEYSKDGNIKELVKLYHPLIIKEMGGKRKAKQMLEENKKVLVEEGIDFVSQEIEESIFDFKGQNHYALLPQYIIMKLADGSKMKVESYLLAISENGENWTFINTGNYQDEKLAAFFPELKGKIEIPKKRFQSID